MPGASFEAITGRLGVGAIAFLGLFLIADGMQIGIYDLVETYGRSTAWGIVGVVPTVVVTYIVGVFCLGVSELLLARVRSFPSSAADELIDVSLAESALLQQVYSEHLRNHDLS